MSNGALIIGGSYAGLKSAQILADSGIAVHLVVDTPFFRDGSTPADSAHLLNAQLLEIEKNPNITIWTNALVNRVKRAADKIQVEIIRKPRYVDLSRCTACGTCVEVCPVTIPSIDRKAIYLDGQPGCMVIDKVGKSPCANACPSGVHVQGYVALINQGRYLEAIELIREVMPFPSVCGRVCNHQCEAACSRTKVDQAVNIMALKRFAADWWYQNQPSQTSDGRTSSVIDPTPGSIEPSGKSVAVIGAGPTGLTAARDLVRVGHNVKVFDALPVAGGMMRVGIPPHRLPSHLLDWEIQQILDEGVELVLNTKIDNISDLRDQGYQAVLIATGAHKAKKLPLPNSDHCDNWLSLDFLREARLGEEGLAEKLDLSGKNVVVLGGGNVALDSSRVAVRLGAKDVRVACLEPRGEMPGFEWEIQAAEEEGIKIYPGRTFKEIVVRHDEIIGVRCVEVDFRGFVDGRPDMDEIADTEHVPPADLVIWAIGQQPDLAFLEHDQVIQTDGVSRILCDVEMATSVPGVFVAGDVRRGVTFFVVDAIGEGHRAARSIDRYLRGEAGLDEPVQQPVVELSEQEIEMKLTSSGFDRRPRREIASILPTDRQFNFDEVELPFSEEQARAESGRCMACGTCSECLACVNICSAKAINHDQLEEAVVLDFGALVWADDSQLYEELFDSQSPGVYRVAPEDEIEALKIAAIIMGDLGIAKPRPLRLMSSSIQQASDRIGVLVCECGGAVSDILDLQKICDQALMWPGVVHCQILSHACLPESAQLIHEVVKVNQLEKVVLGSCSCCALDQVCYSCTYQRVRCKNNLGIFFTHSQAEPDFGDVAMFEFVNIREQCAWVHSDDPDQATSKALLLLGAAVSQRHASIDRIVQIQPVERSVLILGGGDAAEACGKTLKDLKISAHHVSEGVGEIKREGGCFVVSTEGGVKRASALVFAPAHQEQHKFFLDYLEMGRSKNSDTNQKGTAVRIRPGVFYCDFTKRANASGAAAAANAAAWLTTANPVVGQTMAIVEPIRCRACGTCVDLCVFHAPEIKAEGEARYAWIDPMLCSGCGICVVHCPTGAISKYRSPDDLVAAASEALIKQQFLSADQVKIAVFSCNWNAHSAIEAAGKKRLRIPAEIIPFRVSCLGEVNPGLVLKSFEIGFDGVLLVGCLEDTCHYHPGGRKAESVYTEAKSLMHLLGYQDERIGLLRIANNDGVGFANFTQTFVNHLRGRLR